MHSFPTYKYIYDEWFDMVYFLFPVLVSANCYCQYSYNISFLKTPSRLSCKDNLRPFHCFSLTLEYGLIGSCSHVYEHISSSNTKCRRWFAKNEVPVHTIFNVCNKWFEMTKLCFINLFWKTKFSLDSF
jgi:hypothetical protein